MLHGIPCESLYKISVCNNCLTANIQTLNQGHNIQGQGLDVQGQGLDETSTQRTSYLTCMFPGTVQT